MTDEGKKMIENRILQLEDNIDSYRYRLNEAIESLTKKHNASPRQTPMLAFSHFIQRWNVSSSAGSVQYFDHPSMIGLLLFVISGKTEYPFWRNTKAID